MSTPRAGKNMAAPVANCAATGGTPTSAPDDIGYTTPNSYAQVNMNVIAKKIEIRFMLAPLVSPESDPQHAPCIFVPSVIA